MPKDKQGRTLRVGDVVLIPARIRNLFAGDDWTNVIVSPLESMPPTGQVQMLSVNGCQVELFERWQPAEAALGPESDEPYPGESQTDEFQRAEAPA